MITQKEQILNTNDSQVVRKAKDVLRALDHPLRKKVLELINENQEMPVGDIYRKLRIEQSVASQHLKILRDAAVVNTTRDGKSIRYSINSNRIKDIISTCKSI